MRRVLPPLLLCLAACADETDGGRPIPEPPPPDGGHFTLTLQLTGSGSGVVSTTDDSLVCEGQCTFAVPAGSAVTLVARPGLGSRLRAWSGECSGTGECIVVLDRDRTVGAELEGGRATGGRVFAADGQQWSRGLAVADDGTRVMAARLAAPLEIGGHVLDVEFGTPLALIRFSAAGDVLWARRYGNQGHVVANDVAVVDGAIYVAGEYTSAPDLGAGPLLPASGVDAFVARFSLESGEIVWSKRLGTTGQDRGMALVVTGGGVVAVGTFFDGYMGVATLAFADGANDGIQPLTNGGQLDVADAVLSADGDLVIAGRFLGEVTFDGYETNETSTGMNGDAFVVRYSLPERVHEWTVVEPAANRTRAAALLAAPDGGTWVSGDLWPIQSSEAKPALGDGGHAWVTYLSPGGQSGWRTTIPTSLAIQLSRLALGPGGRLYAAGLYRGEVELAGLRSSADGDMDALLVCLDAGSGNAIWMNSLGGAGSAAPDGLAVQGDSVLITGTTDGPLDLDGVLTSHGPDSDTDMFLATFAR
jgi:hypothetical protein